MIHGFVVFPNCLKIILKLSKRNPPTAPYSAQLRFTTQSEVAHIKSLFAILRHLILTARYKTGKSALI